MERTEIPSYIRMHTDERTIATKGATFQTIVKTTGWGVRLTFLAKNNRDSFKISR